MFSSLQCAMFVVLMTLSSFLTFRTLIHRSESDLVNVVEQRIWHSVLEGDFEKLPGQGKPLKMEGNPHMDPAEDLAYRILYQNGFAPEWIELNKEIRFHMERWRRALRMSWKRKADSCTGDAPRREELWSADLKFLEHELNEINKKVGACC